MDLHQAKVKQFHQTFGVPVSNTPKEPSWEERCLRIRLIYEELLELAEASGVHTDLPEAFEIITDGEANLVEVADALADLEYVVKGAACTFGIDLEPVFSEVHRSNMTKTGGRTREDGKILKGPEYEPPRIAPILAEQTLGFC